MFPPPGCRTGFPREPAPWWDGPWPCPPGGPEDAWDEPPWQEPPWQEPPWERRHRRPPPNPRAFPGPGDIPWKEEEEDRRWPPPDCALPPPWDDRAAVPGAEGDFGECWYQDPPPDPWPEYPEEEQPWPPAGPPGWVPGCEVTKRDTSLSLPGLALRRDPSQPTPPALGLCSSRNPGTSRGHRPPWSHRPAGRRRNHPRQLLLVPRAWCPRPPRGHKPRSKPSCPAPSKRSQPVARKELQPPSPPQPPAPPHGAEEGLEQAQAVPGASGDVLEPPSPARNLLESPAADPGAAELLVELEAGQSPVGSQHQDPCAPGTDPAPPEESSRYPEIQEHLEVEPCSPGVPKAGSSHRSHPQSPAAPARRELLECSSSAEPGAELSPHSRAGGAEAGAAQDGPLQSLQPPENPQLPPGCAAEPEVQPSQASPGASPGSQHPPGAGETNLAVCGQQQLSPVLPTPFPAGIDSRSAAVLRRKAKIELSYQQFSLSIAVVATMLLQKEPSMEAALGLALRANLRQCRLHHLQQLEDFINSLDSGTASL